MNILFVLYGDFRSNSANPLALYARELQLRGHKCAIAVPLNLESVRLHEDPAFIPILCGDVLASPESVFPDGRPADVIHACTPREVVRRFIMSYMAKRPTPLVLYLEDNELWISTRALGLNEATLSQRTEREISAILPDSLAHPFYYDSFIGLADAVAVIQDKLRVKVPPWVHCETVMLGVDLEFFSPRPADVYLRKQYGVAEDERVIVYHGGLNEFTKPAIETLCRAVGLINQRGYPCRLLRTGPFALGFLQELPRDTVSAINDLGLLPRRELPNLLALADVFVQPGEIDSFEDLRLAGKVPEFLAMGRPVVLPDVNIAHLFRDGLDAVLLHAGTSDEIAAKCIELFSNPQRACEIGRAGRRLAERYFDVGSQACLLEGLYKTACRHFDPAIALETWRDPEENIPVTLLLARKLKSLAALSTKLGFEAGDILREHARYVELMQRRVGGLEAAIAERDSNERNTQILSLRQQIALRDRQVVELNTVIDGFLNSTSWKLTLPLRKAKAILKLVSQRMNSLWLFGRV
jgi:glycosyltransferase involved in cell wall biosynthesis